MFVVTCHCHVYPAESSVLHGTVVNSREREILIKFNEVEHFFSYISLKFTNSFFPSIICKVSSKCESQHHNYKLNHMIVTCCPLSV